jgi:transglutaminase-like putative cysteine protease
MSWKDYLGAEALPLRAIPLYAAVFVAFAAASNVLYEYVGVPATLYATLMAAALAVTCGYVLRAWPRFRWLGLIPGMLLAYMATRTSYFGDFDLAPDEVHAGFYIAMIFIVLSFVAATDDSILFLLVPPLAMTIAGASQSIDEQNTAGVLIYCLAALGALIYHAHLRDESGPGVRLALRQMLLNQVTLLGLTFITTGFLALLALVPFQIVGRIARPYLVGNSAFHAQFRLRSHAMTPFLYGAPTGSSTLKVGLGPITPSHEPIMRVTASRPTLMLGRIFTDYEADGWADIPEPEPPAITTAFGRSEVEPDVYTDHWPIMRQDVMLLVSSAVLPVAPTLASIQIVNSAQRFHIDSHLCVRMGRGSHPMLMYRAESRLPPSLDEVTEGTADMPSPPPPRPILVPERVSRLARSLQGKGAVQTTHNIMSYLQSHCTYDLSAPAVPSGRDAVDFFVFDSHAGYCDLFATSAALLLQLDDIPTRYCTGYAPGQWDKSHTSIIVTAAEAHAWVEVFIRGQGWIPIDPTPPGFTGPESTAVTIRDFVGSLHLDQGLSFPGVLIIMIVFIAGALLYYAHPSVTRRRIYRRLGADPLAGQLAINYWTMQRILARSGLPRKPYETPYEWLNRLRSLGVPPDITNPMGEISRAFVAFRYGGELSEDNMCSALDLLRKAARQPDIRRIMTNAGATQRAGTTITT